MAVSVNPVARPKDESGDLLGLAVGIARDYFKVKMDNKALDAANKLKAKTAEQEATDKQRDQSLSFVKDYEIVEPKARGAIDPTVTGLQLPRGIKIPQGMAIRPRSVAENEAKLAQSSRDKAADQEFKKELAQITAGQKAATEGAQASALFGKRMESANSILSQIEADPEVGVTDTTTMLGNALIPDNFRSDGMKKFINAKKDFVTAVLRKESGASIAPSEFKEADAIYFAQPGDSADIIAQKQARRQLVIDQFKQGAGKAWSGGSNTAIANDNKNSGPSLEELMAERARRQKQGTAQK